MLNEQLPAIAALARVAQRASFTKAAAELGVSPSALSQTVRRLERQLGVRLLERSTRRVGVTELGARFLADARPALAALEAAVAGLDEARDRPAGLLRLNLSRTVFDILLQPRLHDFVTACPDVTLELVCDNNFVDLVAGGFDAGIRLGESLAQDVVGVPLGGPQRLVTVAAPAYLQAHGAPRSPADLVDHRCLTTRFSGSGALYRWEYVQDGHLLEVAVRGPVISNEVGVLEAMVRAGAGIGVAFESTVRDDVASGRLVPLLEPWWPTFPGFHLYHPSRAQVPRKLRVFIDWLQRQWPVPAPLRQAKKKRLTTPAST